MTTLPSNNQAHGFWGTIGHHADPARAWPVAMAAIATATGATDQNAQAFLDSRHGRHFADDVADSLMTGLDLARAVDVAVTRWMSWKITRRMARDCGIPTGLPYLTGFVFAEAIAAEVVSGAQ